LQLGPVGLVASELRKVVLVATPGSPSTLHLALWQRVALVALAVASERAAQVVPVVRPHQVTQSVARRLPVEQVQIRTVVVAVVVAVLVAQEGTVGMVLVGLVALLDLELAVLLGLRVETPSP
jgi:hypothetical protein